MKACGIVWYRPRLLEDRITDAQASRGWDASVETGLKTVMAQWAHSEVAETTGRHGKVIATNELTNTTGERRYYWRCALLSPGIQAIQKRGEITRSSRLVRVERGAAIRLTDISFFLDQCPCFLL